MDEPRSPPPVTVAVAAAPPPNHSLTLALPIQHLTRPPSSSSFSGRDDCWSESATSVLIDAWGERFMELSRGNLKQKHWKEVADIVNHSRLDPFKTDIQCKNRIDTVKKKYKSEKAKVLSGFGPSRWPFFDRLDKLISTSTTNTNTVPVGVRPLPPRPNFQFRPPPMVNSFMNNVSNIVGGNNGLLGRRGQVGPTPTPTPTPPPMDSEDSEGWSGESGDDPPPLKRKRAEFEHSIVGKRRKGKGVGEWWKSVRELTKAVLKFGEAYEAAESAKLRQIVEIEKQRMKFAMEMELQRIKFLMNAQLSGRGNGSGSNDSDCRGNGGGDGSDSGGEGNHHDHHGIRNHHDTNNDNHVDIHAVSDTSN